MQKNKASMEAVSKAEEAWKSQNLESSSELSPELTKSIIFSPISSPTTSHPHSLSDNLVPYNVAALNTVQTNKGSESL